MYTTKRVEDDQQRDEFVRLLNATLYEGDAVNRMEWFYGDSSTVAYLLYKDDEPVGTKGFGLRTFCTPYGLKVGAIAVDLSVLPGHRGWGVAPRFEDDTTADILDNEADFIYAIPNNNSAGLFKRNDAFSYVGNFHRHVKLLDFDQIDALDRVNWARPVINAAYRVMMRPMVKIYEKHYFSTSWEDYDGGELRCGVNGTRSKEYMTWRYAQDNSRLYTPFIVGTNMLVYTVIKNRAYVVDIATRGQPDYLSLFATFETFCRQAGFSVIVVQHYDADQLVTQLEQTFFYRRYKDTDKGIYIGTHDLNLMQAIKDQGCWFAGDEDALGE